MKAIGYEAAGEKPLNPGARLMLVLGVGAVMLSFYVFQLLAILLLSVLIAIELLVLLALARFAAAGLLMPVLQKHVGLLVLLKSFRLRKGVEYRIPLRQDDAPALYEILGHLCCRLELAFPQEVVLQLGDGAWVRLKGMRGIVGKVTLGVGYDLLAGLTVAEMEAVLAHEMTHAKLINRGFKNWVGAGQARIRNLAVALWNEVTAARRAKRSSSLAHGLFVVMDRLVRLSSRLVAAYSREDEFEADWGAAQLCGSGVMNSVLSKLGSLHQISSRLPWNERVAHLQQSSGYSEWLLKEIEQGVAVPAQDSNQALFNTYSTHPLIRDRLAALPPDDKMPTSDSPSGIRLLAHPDAIAVKLVTQLQRQLADQERRGSRVLERFSRRTAQNSHLHPWQSFGVLLVLAGIVSGLIGLGFREWLVLLGSVVAIVVGALAIRLGSYRDRLELPVPINVASLRTDRPPSENVQEAQRAIQTELEKCFPGERGTKRALLLAEESYAALKACDYLRAHVAARECLKYDKRSVEGAMTLAVACSMFGQIQIAIQMLAFVWKRTGFKTFSTSWGAAWAGLLAGDWIRAEAMLGKALKLQPRQSALVFLLAIAQSRRAKLQSAIMNAKRAYDDDPASREKLKFLIARLLDGGFTREAQERIERVRCDLDSDPELMVSMTQLHLLHRNFSEAERSTARIKQLGVSGQMLLRLGGLYETARQKEQAATLYEDALALGHYPEAHLGLGRIETERNNKVEARGHLVAALNVERPPGKEGLGTWQVLQPILTQMLWLRDPVTNCRAWLAAFPSAQPPVLAGKSFVVFAPDLQQAREDFRAMLDALHPGKPPLVLSPQHFSLAPRPMQPDGPVRPGVQGIWH